MIPFYNEKDSLESLVKSLHGFLDDSGRPFEVILVDDGSTDGSLAVAENLLDSHRNLVLVSMRRNHGKSAALAVGIEKSKGGIILTLDADMQDDPSDIPAFIKAIENGCDLACGWRKPRRDPFFKRLQSTLYNAALRMAGFRQVHDINCGFKAMRREVAENIPLYGERHRLIPLVAAWKGYRVEEVVVNHGPRKHGVSKYGASRLTVAIFDILAAFLLSRSYRKMLSVSGVVMFFAGLVFCAYAAYLKIATGSFQFRYPLLILGVMMLVLGIQVVFASFLAELFIHGSEKSSAGYSIKMFARSGVKPSQASSEK